MNKTFSFDTIENFRNHISLSIPSYDILCNAIISITEYFKTVEHNIYDLGCSDGYLLSKINHSTGKKIGIDISDNLLPKTYDANTIIVKKDLNQGFNDYKSPCIIYSIFTLQFLNKNIRQELINDIYNSLDIGGAFIVAEKVYGIDGMSQYILNLSYFDFKRKSFESKEILDKEYDIRHQLKPFTTKENLEMIKKAGFNNIYCFYKMFNFEAYLCIK
jgi:tRNA (cmo5U34)-methyltransferase